MKDTKFIFSITLLLFLNIAALYVLNFVSLSTKNSQKTKQPSQDFLIKLSQIDSGFESLNFYKKVIIKKEIPKQDVKVTAKVDDKKSDKKNINKEKSFKKISHKSKKTYLKSRKNVDIYVKLVNKFKKTNDFKIALKLSRLYYMKKDYKKSLKWSIIANELNDKDDGSWILFAKSKIKLGEKSLAKKALLTYNKVYHSKSVQELLNRISL